MNILSHQLCNLVSVLNKDQYLQHMAPSHLMKLFEETARFNVLFRASQSKKKDRFNYYSKPILCEDLTTGT